MPRKPIDYSKTIIYKIVCKDTTIPDTYVGQTINFRQRKNQHKSRCNNETDKSQYNKYLYQFIRANGGFENFDMVMIEIIECKNSYEARKRERYWIEELKASLNKFIPTRTKAEYRIDKADLIEQYYTDNSTRILERQREKITCNCGMILNRGVISRHKNRKIHQFNLLLQSSNQNANNLSMVEEEND